MYKSGFILREIPPIKLLKSVDFISPAIQNILLTLAILEIIPPKIHEWVP